MAAPRLDWLPGDPPPGIPQQEHEIMRQMWQQIAETGADRNTVITFRDNRSESFRDGNNVSLLVSEDAYEIQPPGDIGTSYGQPVDDSDVISSLNNPTSYHWYSHNDLQIDSRHNLCQACRNVLNYFCYQLKTHLKPTDLEPRHRLPNLVVHHFNILSLIARSTVDQCQICRKLYASLKARFPLAINDPSNAEEYRVEVCWRPSDKLEDQIQLYFVLTNPSKPKGFWNFAHFFRMELWPTQKFGHHFELPTQISGYGTPERDGSHDEHRSSSFKDERVHTGGPTCRTLAISWLRNCIANTDNNHATCNREPSDFMPTRLLDVQSAEKTEYLRIVCPEKEPEAITDNRSWVTLSHCWGEWGAKKNPITTKSNIVEREARGIHVSKLPQTFQDALEIAKWLGVGWLWIDSLCIIQDSKEDWTREASLMDKIYQNGILNISADWGKDSSTGCFVARDPQDISAIQLSAPALKQSWKLVPDAVDAFAWMYQVPSLSRAWIYRERQLSRRILHFNAKEILWECSGVQGSAFASEMFPNRAPFKRLFNHDTKYQSGRLQEELKPSDPETYAVWNDVCEKFSSKGLTNPTDMPIVLSSLAKEFAELLPGDEYIAGLWRSTLPQSLAWQAEAPKRKGMDEAVAPSWSWMSTGNRVRLQNTLNWQHKHPLINISNMSLEHEYDDIYGLLRHGHLHIRGFLRLVRISISDAHDLHLSVLEGAEYRSIGPAWDDYHGDLCQIRFDESPNAKSLDLYCLPVTMEKWRMKDYQIEITCLLLQKDGKDDSSKFARVGWMKLGGLYSLKMRFMLDSQLKDVMEGYWHKFLAILQYQDEEEENEKRKGSDGRENVHQNVDGQSSGSQRAAPGVPSIGDGNMQNAAPADISTTLYLYDDVMLRLKGFDKLEPQTLTLV